MPRTLLALAALSFAALSAGCTQDSTSASTSTPAPDVQSSAAATSPAKVTTKLAGVLIYADWCGSCKVLDPKVETVKNGGPYEGVSFVKLDYTDKDADAFFAAADQAGVGAAVRGAFAENIKTGQMLLIDTKSQTVVSTIKKNVSPSGMTKAIIDAAAAI
jgi:thiol-disulfide isomerase/thioredoxin